MGNPLLPGSDLHQGRFTFKGKHVEINIDAFFVASFDTSAGLSLCHSLVRSELY